MSSMGRYVITGGPSVGKTTTLDEIAKLGFAVIPEAARQIIEQEEKKENGILPWTDLYGFQKPVYELQMAQERAYSCYDGQVFLDRGIHDGIAYCRNGGIPTPSFLIRAPRTYDAIFLLDRLPKYVNDQQRKEDLDEAIRLHEHIGSIYEELGYDVVRVPVLPPGERAAFIIDYVSCTAARSGMTTPRGSVYSSATPL